MTNVEEIVLHYQRAIDKASINDSHRLLHCINKLDQLPITTNILQLTKIGRTVNNLKRCEDETGIAARDLVAKWKLIVTNEASDNEQQYVEPDVQKEAKLSSSKKRHHQSVSKEKSRKTEHSDIERNKNSLQICDIGFGEELLGLNKKDSGHISNKRSIEEAGKYAGESSRHDSKRLKLENESRHKPNISSSSKPSNGSIQNNHNGHSTKVSSHKSDKHSHKSSSKVSKHSGSKSDKHRSSSHSKESSRKDKKSHQKERKEINKGIDCTSGTSFEAALGMIEPIASTSKGSNGSISTEIEISKSLKRTPKLLTSKVKLPPLEPELPVEPNVPNAVQVQAIISPNYKPMPLNPTVMDCVNLPTMKPVAAKKQITEEEALGISMHSKNMRTKVYSGIKSGAIQSAPSLFDMCIRILQENIDAVEYTGGIPYDILKPILEKLDSRQLLNFEYHNPYIMEDSDVLWEHHCKRNFRNQQRLEYESWREMFDRCTKEMEDKLRGLTKNIKQSQSASLPVRQTKLAYVDSMAKAPRNIQRKQNCFGTEKSLIATPAARVAALSNIATNIAKPGDVRLRLAAGMRDTAQARCTSRGPKRAPLMQKTLQFMKDRFRR